MPYAKHAVPVTRNWRNFVWGTCPRCRYTGLHRPSQGIGGISYGERREGSKISRICQVDSDRPALDSWRQKNTEPSAQAWCGSTAHTRKRHASPSPQLPASRRAAAPGPAFRPTRKRRAAPPLTSTTSRCQQVALSVATRSRDAALTRVPPCGMGGMYIVLGKCDLLPNSRIAVAPEFGREPGDGKTNKRSNHTQNHAKNDIKSNCS